MTLASFEPRVRALFCQVGNYQIYEWAQDLGRRCLIDRARGLIDPPVPQGVDLATGLLGVPDYARMVDYRVLRCAEHVSCPTFILDAKFEELMDIRQNGQAAFKVISQSTTARYETFNGQHYDVYDAHWAYAVSTALEWFGAHL